MYISISSFGGRRRRRRRRRRLSTVFSFYTFGK
jgi:hypothetical protein